MKLFPIIVKNNEHTFANPSQRVIRRLFLDTFTLSDAAHGLE